MANGSAGRVKFRLITIAYVFALFAAAMALAGVWGIALALGALACRSWASSKNGPGLTLAEVLVVVGIVGTLVGLLLPGTGHDLGPMRRWRCASHLQEIVAAIREFRRSNDRMPQDFHTAGGGELSWRVEIMPLVGDGEAYRQLGLGPSWDGKNAGQLPGSSFVLHSCSPHGDGTYFAVTGEQSFWEASPAVPFGGTKDDALSTIILIQASDKYGQWFEPRDLTSDEAVKLLTTKPDWERGDGFFIRGDAIWKPRSVRTVAFADGSVRQLSLPLPHDLAVALLTADGGELIDRRTLDRFSEPKFHYERFISLIAFGALAFFPKRWIMGEENGGVAAAVSGDAPVASGRG
ncbi:MAG: hypothetical protein JNL18_19455 [Planctomycetaceae bacterium]|nr:hypothetical protein [Planctomycetaceae bacterium]